MLVFSKLLFDVGAMGGPLAVSQIPLLLLFLCLHFSASFVWPFTVTYQKLSSNPNLMRLPTGQSSSQSIRGSQYSASALASQTSGPKKNDMRNVDAYLTMREIKKIKSQGGNYEVRSSRVNRSSLFSINPFSLTSCDFK